MYFTSHNLQHIFFDKLKDFLILAELTESSLDQMNLDELKIENWRILFPEGIGQLMLNFDKWQSKESLKNTSLDDMGIDKKIAQFLRF